jgi:hypothetical protein
MQIYSDQDLVVAFYPDFTLYFLVPIIGAKICNLHKFSRKKVIPHLSRDHPQRRPLSRTKKG